MQKVTQTSSRKNDHININLEEEVGSLITTGLEKYRFENNALPEINLSDISLTQHHLSKNISSPILISSMTGGTKEAKEINVTLAQAAQEKGIAMGLGSQRAAIEDSSLISSFQVRKYAPDILLFANLGAVQLNYGYSIDECQKAVDMVEADALILHLNALQEAIQPEGDTNFKNLLSKISKVCKTLSVPVIVKEVGWGISGNTAKCLIEAGVYGIDVAGAGGTSWTQVEMYRSETPAQKELAGSFIGWGIPTSNSIIDIKSTITDATIYASGGLRNGIDIAKCISLGAKLGGMASPFLKAAVDSLDKTIEVIDGYTNQIKICMFATGCKTIEDLSNTNLVKN